MAFSGVLKASGDHRIFHLYPQNLGRESLGVLILERLHVLTPCSSSFLASQPKLCIPLNYPPSGLSAAARLLQGCCFTAFPKVSLYFASRKALERSLESGLGFWTDQRQPRKVDLKMLSPMSCSDDCSPSNW